MAEPRTPRATMVRSSTWVTCTVQQGPNALAGNIRGVDVESGARLARTQDEGAVGPYVEAEDTASGVPGRQNAAKVTGRGTRWSRPRAAVWPARGPR